MKSRVLFDNTLHLSFFGTPFLDQAAGVCGCTAECDRRWSRLSQEQSRPRSSPDGRFRSVCQARRPVWRGSAEMKRCHFQNGGGLWWMEIAELPLNFWLMEEFIYFLVHHCLLQMELPLLLCITWLYTLPRAARIGFLYFGHWHNWPLLKQSPTRSDNGRLSWSLEKHR